MRCVIDIGAHPREFFEHIRVAIEGIIVVFIKVQGCGFIFILEPADCFLLEDVFPVLEANRERGRSFVLNCAWNDIILYTPPIEDALIIVVFL